MGDVVPYTARTMIDFEGPAQRMLLVLSIRALAIGGHSEDQWTSYVNDNIGDLGIHDPVGALDALDEAVAQLQAVLDMMTEIDGPSFQSAEQKTVLLGHATLSFTVRCNIVYIHDFMLKPPA